jgi:sigma-B regulation protein RsbU (phosphoserine phosphatase)
MQARILVADDSAVNRALLSDVLRKAGYQPVLAVSGEEALLLIKAAKPDLLLLDVLLPGKDGFEIMAELRQDPATADLPVIFLTGLADTRDKVRAFELGAVDFITKPMNVDEILARVRVQLRVRELSNSLARANDDLRRWQKMLQDDLKAAADIQRALLPQGPLELPHLSGASLFLPTQSVGGDIFSVQQLDPQTACAWVLDVSGHGVPSAMITVSVAQRLSLQGGVVASAPRATSSRIASPKAVLTQLDADYPMERFDRFFTIAYLVLDLERGRLVASSAGHPPPLVLRRGEPPQELTAGGSVIGLGAGGFEEQELTLEDGDRVILYTDGLLDYEDLAGEPYGLARLAQLLTRTRDLPLVSAVEQLGKDLRSHGGGVAPLDDVTLLALEWRAAHELFGSCASTLEGVRGLAVRLREHWRAGEVPDQAAQELELAFVEAATNIVVHAYKSDPAQEVRVRSIVAGAVVVLELRDRGAPARAGFPGAATPSLDAESGRGVFLIRSLVDALAYTSGPDGNVLALRKRI